MSWKTYLSDVIGENCSNFKGGISRSNFEKYQLVIDPPMQLAILLQRIEYNYDTGEYCKNKTKIALPSQYFMSFSGIDDEFIYNTV